MGRPFGFLSCFKNNEASGSSRRPRVGNGFDPPAGALQRVGRDDRRNDASGPIHVGRARLPADSRGSRATGEGSHDEASGSCLIPPLDNGADVPGGQQIIGRAVHSGLGAAIDGSSPLGRGADASESDRGDRAHLLTGREGSEITGGDHGGGREAPADDRRNQDSGGDYDSNGFMKDRELLKDAEEGAGARTRLTTKDGLEEEEEDDDDYILSQMAFALFLNKDLPELTYLGRFQRSRRQDDGSEALGQSSNDPVAVPDTFCCICMENKYSFEFMAMKGCEHTFCAHCVSLYVATKVESNEGTVRCPDPRCKGGLLEPDMCRFILPPAIMDRWGARLCEEGIPEPEKCYCPYRDCSALLIVGGEDNGKVIVMSDCPHCRRAICARCRVPWHTGLKCTEFQRLGAGDRTKEDQMVLKLARKNKWQRCPKCGFLVERTAGCNYMKCRCQHTFCYKCAGPVSRRDHSCPKCKIWG